MSERRSSIPHGERAGPDTGLAEETTIALLQEEIERLEDELRIRDGLAQSQPLDPEPLPLAELEEAQEQIERLTSELGSRQETIILLLEQIRLADEAEASSRAEWEQLHQWVENVERRVEQTDAPGTDGLRAALADEQRNSEALRLAAESRERSWDLQRQALVTEVERLRQGFTEVAGGSDPTVAALQVLEAENEQLRNAYAALAANSRPEHELDAIAAELRAVRQERDKLFRELQSQRDDRQREHNEQEAALNALRSQLARESLRRQEEQVKLAAALPPTKDQLLEADQRIRAFREHLKEIHIDESEQRSRRGLAARLSRLWNHTSPNK